jgi:hypothetical protein
VCGIDSGHASPTVYGIMCCMTGQGCAIVPIYSLHRLQPYPTLIIASKVTYNRVYWNNSWCTVSQGLFTLHEINQMEHKMCSHLDWHLNVTLEALNNFEEKVQKESTSESTLATPTPAEFSTGPSTDVEPLSKFSADFVNTMKNSHLPS